MEELLRNWTVKHGFDSFEFYVNMAGVDVYRIKKGKSGDNVNIPLLVRIINGNEVVKLECGEAIDAMQMKQRRFAR